MPYEQALNDGEEGDDDRRLGVVRRATDTLAGEKRGEDLSGGEEQGPDLLLSGEGSD
jgi:hypothetical protein